MHSTIDFRSPGGPDALIREARRRQRIRHLIIAAACLAMTGAAAGLSIGLGRTSRPANPPGAAPHSSPHPRPAPPVTVPRLPPIAARIMMWPLGYPLGVGNYPGPPFVVDNLGTGRYAQTGKVDLCCGDYQPLMITAGRWLIHAGNGATAVRDDLRGRPRVLGGTSLFAPSAASRPDPASSRARPTSCARGCASSTSARGGCDRSARQRARQAGCRPSSSSTAPSPPLAG